MKKEGKIRKKNRNGRNNNMNKNQTKLKINNNQTATVTIPNDQVEIFMEMLALGETEWLASDRVENYLPWRGWTWESRKNQEEKPETPQ